MKRFILPIFLLISSSTFAAIDIGDGSDGACSLGGAISVTSTVSGTAFNCTSLVTTGAITVSDGNPLIIKVQGDATIDHTITLLGTAGGAAAGGGVVAGAEGGDATNAVCGGFSFADIGGSGGAGGSHVNLGGNGGVGQASGPTDGLDTMSAPGSTTTTYDSALSLETQIRGGSGGGNGGDGCESSGTFTEPGGTPGGAGGGALHLAAGGDIYINAQIDVRGGNGQPGTSSANGQSGGSGAGAGGVIFLQSSLNIELNSALLANGGTGGAAGGALAGAGGDGGDGIIRLDDLDGTITGVGGSYSPSPTIITHGATSLETLSSGIEPGCAVREDMTPKNQTILGALLLLILMIGLNIKETKKAN
ncbi:hypothetical protein BALOs_0563 [Halobacteriovorax sp. BALOs_7]|uniref:Uncharacterized protein n=1 Tax=Halobacteriovorax vibrionivorans TaxID=2152716 RepID=A0ABY0IFX8_9BACT|nr:MULTISPECIES: hypothetical protein [Halobacteriovorax]AYF43575.1 hypothetical protein BALOs_0563 [Halobacteriovorax sp. BALOs_7]RZF21857.1 hypothetical protein DAY19_09210 [Halobacteriovorax vibrionivorans]TGD48309.1 hypothetical protein EP118_04085 [Halobacteriovorax sp. Y22]